MKIESFVNKIFNTDCLNILIDIPDNSIDLIYIDPPFGNNKTDKQFRINWIDEWNSKKQKYINANYFSKIEGVTIEGDNFKRYKVRNEKMEIEQCAE